MKKGNCLLLLLAILSNNIFMQAEAQTKPKVSWVQQKRETIKKNWFCLCHPKKCSKKEVATSKKWFVKTPTKIIVATLAAIGVAVTTYYVSKQQQNIGNEKETFKEGCDLQYIPINRQQRLALRSANDGITRKVALTCKNVIDILQYSFTKIEDALAAFKQQYGTEPAQKLKQFVENCNIPIKPSEAL